MRLILWAVDVWLFSRIWGNVRSAVSDIKGMAFVLSPGCLRQSLGKTNRANICIFPLNALLACRHFYREDFQSWMWFLFV